MTFLSSSEESVLVPQYLEQMEIRIAENKSFPSMLIILSSSVLLPRRDSEKLSFWFCVNWRHFIKCDLLSAFGIFLMISNFNS